MSDAMALNPADKRHDNEHPPVAITADEARLIATENHSRFIAEVYLIYHGLRAEPPGVIYARVAEGAGVPAVGCPPLCIPVMGQDQRIKQSAFKTDRQHRIGEVVIPSLKQHGAALPHLRRQVFIRSAEEDRPAESASAPVRRRRSISQARAILRRRSAAVRKTEAARALLSQVYKVSQALQLKEAVTVAEPDFSGVLFGSVGWFLGYAKPKRKPRTTEALSPIVVLVAAASLATLVGAGGVAIAGLLTQSGPLAWASLALLACHIGVSTIAGAMRKTAAAS